MPKVCCSVPDFIAPPGSALHRPASRTCDIEFPESVVELRENIETNVFVRIRDHSGYGGDLFRGQSIHHVSNMTRPCRNPSTPATGNPPGHAGRALRLATARLPAARPAFACCCRHSLRSGDHQEPFRSIKLDCIQYFVITRCTRRRKPEQSGHRVLSDAASVRALLLLPNPPAFNFTLYRLMITGTDITGLDNIRAACDRHRLESLFEMENARQNRARTGSDGP